MAVILVGNGELAARLIVALESDGNDVVLVTPHMHEAEEFALAFPRTMVLHGDARDPAVLDQARAEAADQLVAATDDDATNLSVCLLAREAFHVRAVSGLAGHPRNARIFRALHIPCVSCAEIVADAVMGAIGDRALAGAR
jgi:trk system potassium uptake protein TrkA